MYNYGHVNISGAEKVSKYLSSYISQNYNFSECINDIIDWDKCDHYNQVKFKGS